MAPSDTMPRAMAGKELARARSDHTGGLRRPAGLRELFADHYDKTIDDEQLEAGLARIIAGVIRKRLGLKLESSKVDGCRTYRIVGGGGAEQVSSQARGN